MGKATYKGVRITPTEDGVGYRLSAIDRESIFDSISDAKDFIASEKNPATPKRRFILNCDIPTARACARALADATGMRVQVYKLR